MYLANSSGLETRISSYLSSSGSQPHLGNSSPAVSYSKLESKANEPQIGYNAGIETINLDKPIEIISGFSKTSGRYEKAKDYRTTGQGYLAGAYSSAYTGLIPQTVERFNPSSFLSDKRVPVQFVGSAGEIRDLITEAFMKTTGMYFPPDITVRVCDEKTMKKFNRNWMPNINGFCFNRKGRGISEVFVLKGELDRVMLTIGHEIGHCLSRCLEDPKAEEAKAFAFSIAWAKKIKEFNIGNLAMNIKMNPEINGLHDVALGFVLRMMKKGEGALDIYRKLVIKELSMEGKDDIPVSC